MSLSYERYSLAWHHILWEADYATKLEVRRVSRSFTAAVDDILCGEKLLFVPSSSTSGCTRSDSAGGLDWKAECGGARLPFFHYDGSTASQIKAIQKATTVVFRTDTYPALGALLGHTAAGTKVALSHESWWPLDVNVPPEVVELALLPSPHCACDPKQSPRTTFSHCATMVNIALDLKGVSATSLSAGLRCHLLRRWWSPSVETVCITMDGPLPPMKAVIKHLFSCVVPAARQHLSVSLTLNDVRMSKLDHRWLDKEFAILGIDNFGVLAVDRATGTLADEKHDCYELEWAFAGSSSAVNIFSMDTEAASKSSRPTGSYVPPSKRAQAAAEPTSGPYVPPGKRLQAMEGQHVNELIAKALQLASETDTSRQPFRSHPLPLDDDCYIPPWRRPGAKPRQSNFTHINITPEEHEEFPENDEIPIALGGGVYQLGPNRYELDEEIVPVPQPHETPCEPPQLLSLNWDETGAKVPEEARCDGESAGAAGGEHQEGYEAFQDYCDQVPIALGGDQYRFGSRTYTLDPAPKTSWVDGRFRPMRDVSPDSEGRHRRGRPPPPVQPERDILREFDWRVVPPQPGREEMAAKEKPPETVRQRSLHKMKSWASRSSDSDASAVPIET